MSIEIKRENKHVLYLTDDKTYSYDSPQVYAYQEPFVLLPGDELLTTCAFNTMNRNKTIFFGEATQDEMCFGFITYYPLQNISRPFCLDHLEVSTCNRASWGECNLEKYIQALNTTSVFQEVTNNCQTFYPCTVECVDTIVKYLKTEPCLKGNVWEFIQERLSAVQDGKTFLSRLASCKAEVYMTLNPSQKEVKIVQGPSGGSRVTTGSLAFLTMSLIVLQMLS